MKKEVKNKVGRPKLADAKLKKESLFVVGGMMLSVLIATILGIATLKVDYDPKYYVGTIYNTHVSSCVIEKNKLDCGPNVIYLKYKIDNKNYIELRKKDKSIEVDLGKVKTIKYCYKTNDSNLKCNK